MDLQELIARGRFLFARAPERLKVFEAVDGRRSAKEIRKRTKRTVTNILRDLQTLRDAGLVQPRVKKNGSTVKKDGFVVYEKIPLARTISPSYFRGPTALRGRMILGRPPKPPLPRKSGKASKALLVPTEKEILDICKSGEDQLYEFKGQGTDVNRISREIAAMSNTRTGGIVLYGIGDDGTIEGVDLKRQAFDQRLQNSVRQTISPALTVKLSSVSVIGSEVFVIVVPPWNRRDVYQFDGRILLRKGTNVFFARPEEVQRLHRGQYVV